jgi:hypothetical protein
MGQLATTSYWAATVPTYLSVAMETGGNGPHQFVFRPSLGTNTITDFDLNNDHLQLDRSIFGSSSDLSDTVDTLQGALISDRIGDSVLLLHVTEAQDFRPITGRY